MTAASSAADPTIVDATSLFDACEVLTERCGGEKITIDYGALRRRLEAFRASRGWRPASLSTILMAIDPNSEGQQRFMSMLSHSGFEPDVVHFRETFVSAPPGRNFTEMFGKSIVSLAARIAYIAGLMARHPEAQLLVVCHSFELYSPLTDLRRRAPKGKVGIAYFGSLLDYRWKSAELLDGNLDVEFLDLDQHSKELVGVDIGGAPATSGDAPSGLSRF